MCVFFRVLFFPSALIYICAFFRCTFFLCAFFQCAFSGHPLHASHRIGQKPRSQQHVDRRNIIVKLCRSNLKDELLSACRSLRPNIYLNESLTPTRSTILYSFRKVKRMLPDKISGCKSESGRVYVFLKNNEGDDSHRRNKKILVNTRLKLEDMCNTVFITCL